MPEQPVVSMPDRESPETPGEPADTSDDDHDEQTTAEPVPHRSSSHTGNGDRGTRCLLRNLVNLRWRDDELLQRHFQLVMRKKCDRND